MTSVEDFFGDPIHTYTRADAIADGTLRDVTDTAREAGFVFPVALTRGAWEETVAWTETDEDAKPDSTGQDEDGRLWDVLTMLRHRIASLSSAEKDLTRLTFTLVRVPRSGDTVEPQRVELAAVMGADDTGGPALTVMLPGED